MVFSGDVCHANEVDACFKASKLWEHVKVMHLSANMRAHLRTGTLAGKSDDANIPFEFKRLQFPIRVCFAMSTNKAQGQSVTLAGLYLQAPCFSHGQYFGVLTCSACEHVYCTLYVHNCN